MKHGGRQEQMGRIDRIRKSLVTKAIIDNRWLAAELAEAPPGVDNEDMLMARHLVDRARLRQRQILSQLLTASASGRHDDEVWW